MDGEKMDCMERYQAWVMHPGLDESLKRELMEIRGDQVEIEGRFHQDLKFGTGGLRGIMGAGSNRMNIYTVRKATRGLAGYILNNRISKEIPVVVLGYDSRRLSKEFAAEAALVLAKNGLKPLLFSEPLPTPLVAFAVRELAAAAGIVITASHNPPRYNGYKVYGPWGGQITDEAAKKIMEEIDRVRELDVAAMNLEEAANSGLLQLIGRDVTRKYKAKVKSLSLDPAMVRDHSSDLSMVYTPLHGTGGKMITAVLKDLGFSQVYMVPEQGEPHGDFPTVKNPNPEEPEAFEMAMKLGKEVDADIILATDPDADRLGVAAKDGTGEYGIVTGNQLGALMLEHILSRRRDLGTLPDNGVVIKTMVTSEMGCAVANHYGIETMDTLTGFKYIGEKIKNLQNHRFLFGYEESCGYLIGDFVRDKDAVQACQVTAEMALFLKRKGYTLQDKLGQLYERFGYYKEDLASIFLEGKQGQEKMKGIMNAFRKQPPRMINGKDVVSIRDYSKGQEACSASMSPGLPETDAIKYVLEDGSWFCVRPSGTEPKIKLYFGVRGTGEEEALNRLTQLRDWVMVMVRTSLPMKAK